MGLLTRKIAVLAKIEPVYGVDAVPTGAANAILAEITPGDITPLAGSTVERAYVQPFLGAFEQIHVGTHVMIKFRVEIAGAGSAGGVPAWDALMRCCGCAATNTPAVDTEYNLISSGFESVTVYFSMDGQRHAMIGVKGNVRIVMAMNQIPKFEFTLTGMWVTPASATDPTLTLTSWVTPVPVNNTNTTTASLDSADLILNNLTLDAGQQVQHSDRPNEEMVNINDRKGSGSFEAAAPALSSKNWFSIAKAGGSKELIVEHGTVAGNIVRIAASGQILQPSYGTYQGEATIRGNLALIPGASGNDELQITAK